MVAGSAEPAASEASSTSAGRLHQTGHLQLDARRQLGAQHPTAQRHQVDSRRNLALLEQFREGSKLTPSREQLRQGLLQMGHAGLAAAVGAQRRCTSSLRLRRVSSTNEVRLPLGPDLDEHAARHRRRDCSMVSVKRTGVFPLAVQASSRMLVGIIRKRAAQLRGAVQHRGGTRAELQRSGSSSRIGLGHRMEQRGVIGAAERQLRRRSRLRQLSFSFSSCDASKREPEQHQLVRAVVHRDENLRGGGLAAASARPAAALRSCSVSGHRWSAG